MLLGMLETIKASLFQEKEHPRIYVDFLCYLKIINELKFISLMIIILHKSSCTSKKTKLFMYYIFVMLYLLL